MLHSLLLRSEYVLHVMSNTLHAQNDQSVNLQSGDKLNLDKQNPRVAKVNTTENLGRLGTHLHPAHTLKPKMQHSFEPYK